MTKAFGTSVLVAALSRSHEGHDVARLHLAEVLRGEDNMVVSTHAFAETYATLTVLPVRPRITPGQAQHLIRNNVQEPATIVDLDADDYMTVIGRMTELGLESGAIYDGLHVRSAEKAEADALLTFNGRDFRRMPPANPTELVIL